MNNIKNKLVVVICIILFIGTCFCLTQQNKRKQPVEALIGITSKTSESTPPFTVKFKDNDKKIEPAPWLAQYNSQGYIIKKVAASMDLEITALKDAQINIVLRGPYERIDGDNPSKRLKEIWVKYTQFTVNGKSIIHEDKVVWHNKPYGYVIKAQKGNWFLVHLEWEKADK